MTVTVVDSHDLDAVLAESREYEEPQIGRPEPKAEPKLEAEPKAEEVDDDDEDEDGVTAAQKRELSGKMLKAIGKKHRQVKEAEEFAAHQYQESKVARLRADGLERELQETKARMNPAPAKIEPLRHNFANESDYIDAKITWGVDQGIEQRETARVQTEAKAGLSRQLSRAIELMPDFRQVTEGANQPLPEAVVEYMQASDMFAELGYHLAKNPKVLEKLSGLPAMRQMVAIAKIEATLSPFGAAKEEPEAREAPVAKAAAPSVETGLSPSKARSAPVIRPLTSGEGQQFEPDARDMNVRETIQTWQKANKANFNLRKRH